MKEYGAEMAQRPEGDSIWREISQRMGGKRTRQQIRIKWFVLLHYAHIFTDFGGSD
jgi:hypothetical protein